MPGTTNRPTPPPESGQVPHDAPREWRPSGRGPHDDDSRRRPLARVLGLVATILLHALFFLFAWVELKPHGEPPLPPPPDSGALQVQLIASNRPSREVNAMAEPTKAQPPAPTPPQAAEVAPPRPAPLAHAHAPAPTLKPQPQHIAHVVPPPRPIPHPEPTKPDAMTATMPATKPAPHLFDANGNPVLPTDVPKPAAKPDQYIAHNEQGDTQILQQTDPTHYHATRFDASWHRPGAVDRAVEKAVKKTSVGHTFHLPGGVRIHCSLSLAAMGGGCGGDPPPPPSKKDGDERLSLPPPSLLAKNPHAPKPPSVESCIAAYRADQPLPQGCPFDIPQRAVDQEAKERAEQERRRTQWGH